MQLTVEFDRETDGRHIAEVLELPGCLVYGHTRREAEARAMTCALRILADQVDSGERDSRDVGEISFGEGLRRARERPHRVRDEVGSCPLGIPHVPNAETVAAMLEPRRGPRFKSVEDLLADLHAED